MSKKIAINGFGRIGRLAFRELFDEKDIEIVAINDLTPADTLAHLLKYDSAQGRYKTNSIKAGEGFIEVDGKKVKIFSERDAKDLPWKKLKIDLVIESTGFYVSKEASQAHIDAGAKKVVISAPAKGDLKTIVYNVNHDSLDKKDKVISAASCTTNALAPVANVLNQKFGLESGFMTTVHAFTNDQKTADSPHKDLRRARAASYNIIPTTTGAAVAVGKVLPELNGKLDGMAMRVPVITGSVVDLVFTLKNEASVEAINKAFKTAANDTIGYTEDPITSTDVIGISYGTLVDATLTKEMNVDGKQTFKVITWYDNELSYVSQLCRTVKYFASL